MCLGRYVIDHPNQTHLALENFRQKHRMFSISIPFPLIRNSKIRTAISYYIKKNLFNISKDDNFEIIELCNLKFNKRFGLCN